jgi:hypothetical protein
VVSLKSVCCGDKSTPLNLALSTLLNPWLNCCILINVKPNVFFKEIQYSEYLSITCLVSKPLSFFSKYKWSNTTRNCSLVLLGVHLCFALFFIPSLSVYSW